jgi:hypothetical protein
MSQRLSLLVATILLSSPAFGLDQTLFPPSAENNHDNYYLYFKGEPSRNVIKPVSPADFDELVAVHKRALQSDPALKAEGDGLAAKYEAHKQRFKAAMIRADPAVAPLLVKPEPGTSVTTTSVPMGEESRARAAALAANPALKPEGDALYLDMEAHRKKVDAAMIQANPDVARILAKFSIEPR